MKINCRICGDEFDFPDGKRGKRPTICKSEACLKEKKRYDNIRFREKQAEKEKTPKVDLSKAGWPPDTKKCQTCGKLFISDSKSRVCPVCLSTPLPSSIDDSLAEAKAAGYDPEDYGKYKAVKALAKAGRVDVGLVKPEDKELEYDIYKETGFEGDLNEQKPVDMRLVAKMESTKRAIDGLSPKYTIVDELYHSDPIGKVVSTKTTEQGFKAIIEVEPGYQLPSQCETCQPTNNHDFICALEDLMDMADKWHMDPDKVYPLAEDILRKGIMGASV